MELSTDVECPHCGESSHEHIEFNIGAGDREGINSSLIEQICWECDKTFWFKARVNFEVEIYEDWKKKPKVSK